jgi:SagB-type dehydrogenase family enzyme
LARPRREPAPRSDKRDPAALKAQPCARRLLGPISIGSIEFFDVLHRRNSAPPLRVLTHSALSLLLWHAAAITSTAKDAAGRPVRRRAVASAGGIHPIDIYVEDDVNVVMRYNPLRHCLEIVPAVSRNQWRRKRSEVARAMRGKGGTMILLVADVAAVAARYRNHESLVYRDAGCMIATIQLTAEALGLSCVPLGFLGEALVKALHLDADRYIPCGVLCAGMRTSARGRGSPGSRG